MSIYIALLALVTLYPLIYTVYSEFGAKRNIGVKKKIPLLYYIAVAVFMVIMIGFRSDNTGIDTPRYLTKYTDAAGQELSYMFSDDMSEPGYTFVQIVFNWLGFNFTAFNLVYAVFNMSIVSMLIYKHSKIPWLSYVLYICFGFFVLNLTMMRQTLAISIVIIATLLDKNRGIKDFIKFAIIVYIASLFHSSAIICLSIWFVRKIPFKMPIALLMLLIALVVYLLKPIVVGLVTDLAAAISDRYARHELTEGEAGIKLYIMILVSVIYGLFARGFLKDKWNQFALYMMITMLIVFPAVQAGGAFMRVYYYFYVFMIIYIPNMIDGISKRNDKLLYSIVTFLYIAVGAYMYFSSLHTDTLEVVPYQFFWNTEIQ